MSCGVGCRRDSDPGLLWPWCRPVASAPIRPLAWELPYAAGAAQEMAKKKKKKRHREGVIYGIIYTHFSDQGLYGTDFQRITSHSNR